MKLPLLSERAAGWLGYWIALSWLPVVVALALGAPVWIFWIWAPITALALIYALVTRKRY